MALRDLRETITALAEAGIATDIAVPVRPELELAAYLGELDGGRPRILRFTNVEGHAVPVVGNVASCVESFGVALGIEPGRVVETLMGRLGQPIAPVEVRQAPVHEVDVSSVPLHETLPILTHYVEDSAPYITSGLLQSVDPDTGETVRGIHRMELRNGFKLGVAFINPPLATVFHKYKERAQPMPLAVAIGIDPVTFAAFALKGIPGADKLAVAGGLRGEAVEIVRGELTGITVPARAEFLLEGEVDPADLRTDGPLGEVGGYSQVFEATPTFTVFRVTHRRDPIYHALLPSGPEGDFLLRVVAEASIRTEVGKAFPFVQGIYLTPTTFGSSVVVRCGATAREAVRTLLTRLLTLGVVKKAVAVAEDVDPADPFAVEWSLATRLRPAKDTILLSELRGVPIDPSCDGDFTSGKIGLDATGYGHMEAVKCARLDPGHVAAARAHFGKE